MVLLALAWEPEISQHTHCALHSSGLDSLYLFQCWMGYTEFKGTAPHLCSCSRIQWEA